jgi:hypothetical protein
MTYHGLSFLNFTQYRLVITECNKVIPGHNLRPTTRRHRGGWLVVSHRMQTNGSDDGVNTHNYKGLASGSPGSIPGTIRKKKVVGLEQGPLSLVSTTEELLDRKVAAPV